MRKEPTDRALSGWGASIKKSGVVRVKLRSFLKHFGMKRRGRVAEREIVAWLRDRKLYVRGLKYAKNLDVSVELSDQEWKQIGELLDKELVLQRRFKREILPQLPGLRLIEEEHRPGKTRDRLDFLCEDDSGRAVAVELKRACGAKHGVEQLMRYIDYLRKDGRRRPHGILITGYADQHTRHALQGREKDRHIEWYVYGVVKGKIHIEHVPIQPSRFNSWLASE